MPQNVINNLRHWLYQKNVVKIHNQGLQLTEQNSIYVNLKHDKQHHRRRLQ